MTSAVRVALVGDYDVRHTAHRAIPEALRLAAESLRRPVEPTWVHTSSLDGDVCQQLAGYAAIWEGWGGLVGHLGQSPSRVFLEFDEDPAHQEMLQRSIHDPFENVFRKPTWQPAPTR